MNQKQMVKGVINEKILHFKYTIYNVNYIIPFLDEENVGRKKLLESKADSSALVLISKK